MIFQEQGIFEPISFDDQRLHVFFFARELGYKTPRFAANVEIPWLVDLTAIKPIVIK